MWPFQTKQFSAYLGTDFFVAWENQRENGKPTSRQLNISQLEPVECSIRTTGKFPAPFKKYHTTLRLAPSLGRCTTLQAAQRILGKEELQGLATHWAKTLMGTQWNTWQWQAIQAEVQQPILLCAYKIDANYLSAFQKVKPELLHQIDHLDAHASSWVVCQDNALVQSALVIEGNIVSIRTWPANYTNAAEEVVEKHQLLSSEARSFQINRIVESLLGEVYHRGAL